MKIAIIPARGGSKRIPRKNIKDFFGKPIIAYSIEAAINSALFDEVMVSTDDEEIAEIAIKYGANVPFFRSEENSDDLATTLAVLEEVVYKYEKLNLNFELICCIYPCSPFISSDLIIEAFEKLQSHNFDSIFPIVRYSNSIQRALKIENDRVKMLDSTYLTVRSQDLIPAYYDAGMFYWTKKSILQEKTQLLTDNTGFIEINELKSQDIDNLVDWKLAEIKYEILQSIK